MRKQIKRFELVMSPAERKRLDRYAKRRKISKAALLLELLNDYDKRHKFTAK